MQFKLDVKRALPMRDGKLARVIEDKGEIERLARGGLAVEASQRR